LDQDADLVTDIDDNCPLEANPGQWDADLDGEGDVCDRCPSDATNPADAAGIGDSLELLPALAWAPDPAADRYPIARGILSPGIPFSYSYGCVIEVNGALTWDDPSVPPIGQALYYVVQAANGCSSSGPGTDGQGGPRPAPASCAGP
jgi:hypothetical protein